MIKQERPQKEIIPLKELVQWRPTEVPLPIKESLKKKSLESFCKMARDSFLF